MKKYIIKETIKSVQEPFGKYETETKRKQVANYYQGENANDYITIPSDSNFCGYKVIKGSELTRFDVDGLFYLEKSFSDKCDYDLVVIR